MAMNSEESDKVDLDHATVVAIRRAFYEGFSRSCLKAAWSSIDAFRHAQNVFLGNPLNKQGVSQLKLATSIGRNPGEICRWLQGQSPEWSNLMIVMLALDAGWKDLGELPSKDDRRCGGYSQALFYIQRNVLCDDSANLQRPTGRELKSLEATFSHEQWMIVRHISARRSMLLTQISQLQHIDRSQLDVADRVWGRAFALLRKYFQDTINVAIWRSLER